MVVDTQEASWDCHHKLEQAWRRLPGTTIYISKFTVQVEPLLISNLSIHVEIAKLEKLTNLE